MKMWDEALEEFNKVVRIDAQDAFGWGAVAIVNYHKGDHDKVSPARVASCADSAVSDQRRNLGCIMNIFQRNSGLESTPQIRLYSEHFFTLSGS